MLPEPAPAATPVGANSSERYALLRALREGRAAELADAPTFADMARRTGYR